MRSEAYVIGVSPEPGATQPTLAARQRIRERLAQQLSTDRDQLPTACEPDTPRLPRSAQAD